MAGSIPAWPTNLRANSFVVIKELALFHDANNSLREKIFWPATLPWYRPKKFPINRPFCSAGEVSICSYVCMNKCAYGLENVLIMFFGKRRVLRA